MPILLILDFSWLDYKIVFSLLDPDVCASQEKVWPLSLLAFKQSIHALSLNRHQVGEVHISNLNWKINFPLSIYPPINISILTIQILIHMYEKRRKIISIKAQLTQFTREGGRDLWYIQKIVFKYHVIIIASYCLCTRLYRLITVGCYISDRSYA